MNEFETLSRDIRPQGLTAATGIAFIKNHFPFHLGYQLAESLCSFAKTEAGRELSSLAFHRVTGSSTGDYQEQVIPSELKFGDILLTANPYLLQKGKANLPCIDDLLNLVDSLTGTHFPKGAIRETVREATFAKLDENNMESSVKSRMERIKEVVTRRNEQAWSNYLDALEAFKTSCGGGSELRSDFFIGNMTPLNDALELKALTPATKVNEPPHPRNKNRDRILLACRIRAGNQGRPGLHGRSGRSQSSLSAGTHPERAYS